MQARDIIALPPQFQHEGEGILAAGKSYQHTIAPGHELVFPDASVHLPGKEIQKAVGAEGGIVAGQGNNGAGTAAAALHGEPRGGE